MSEYENEYLELRVGQTLRLISAISIIGSVLTVAIGTFMYIHWTTEANVNVHVQNGETSRFRGTAVISTTRHGVDAYKKYEPKPPIENE